MAGKSRANKHADIDHLSRTELLQRAKVKGVKDAEHMSDHELIKELKGEE